MQLIRRITKVRIFLIPLSITFFELENVRFPCFYEKLPNLGGEM